MYFVGLKKIPPLDETPTVQVAKIVPTNCFDFFKMQVMAISLVPQAEGSLGSRIFIFLEGFKRQGSVTSQYLFVLGHPWWMKKKNIRLRVKDLEDTQPTFNTLTGVELSSLS